MRLFVDTWGWLALADPKDPYHTEAVECYREYGKRVAAVVTSNFVLDESFTLLFRRRPYKEALHFSSGLLGSQYIWIETVTEPRFKMAYELRQRFFDKPRISFTDLSSMAIMTELKISDILTGDDHFSQVGLGLRRIPAR